MIVAELASRGSGIGSTSSPVFLGGGPHQTPPIPFSGLSLSKSCPGPRGRRAVAGGGGR